MKYDEIMQLAHEVGDVMADKRFPYKENISDASQLDFHLKISWLLKRLDSFSMEQLEELIENAKEIQESSGIDLEQYSNLVSLRSMSLLLVAIRKGEKIPNARS